MSPLDDLKEAHAYYAKHRKHYPWAFTLHPATLACMRAEQESIDVIYKDRLGRLRALSCVVLIDTNVGEDSIIVWHPEGGRLRYKRKFKRAGG